MRIAIFSDNFYPELSGISDSVIVLAKEMAKLGHFVDFYVPKYSKADFDFVHAPYKEIDLGERIRVIRFSSVPYRTGTGQGRFVIPVFLRSLKMFISKPDIVHTQLFFGVGLEAIFAARVLRKPVIGTNHTALKQFLRYSPVRLEFFELIMLKYMNWYYERCELVTAPSQSIIDQMKDIGFAMAPHKMNSRVVPNSIVIPEMPSPEERAANRKKFNLSGPTIVYAGRFAQEKNIDILLQAIAILKKSIGAVTLALAGDGLIKEELVQLVEKLGIQSNVIFLGVLDKTELGKLYIASDVCATASTSEVQSITMLEAMAHGLPMVGMDVPGMQEHITSLNGRLSKPENPESMALELSSVLGDHELRKKLSEGARTFAGQFSAECVAKEWEALYAEAIGSYNKRNRIFSKKSANKKNPDILKK